MGRPKKEPMRLTFTTAKLPCREVHQPVRARKNARIVNVGLVLGQIVLTFLSDADELAADDHWVRVLNDLSTWEGGSYHGTVFLPNGQAFHVCQDAK